LLAMLSQSLGQLIRPRREDDVGNRAVSVRRVEDIAQALWRTRVSASTASDLKQKIFGKIHG
jgi:hypothetical protein